MAAEKATRAGALDELVKTSIRLPLRIVKEVDEVGAKLGISNQTIYTLGTFRMLLELGPQLHGIQKKQQMIRKLERYFQNLFKEAGSA